MACSERVVPAFASGSDGSDDSDDSDGSGVTLDHPVITEDLRQMRDHVRFRSDQFAPPDREPWQVGGERFGYALATWVSAALAARGFDVDSPVAEDWGWLLGVSQDGQVVHVGCGNVEGSLSEWLIWLDVARTGLIGRLLRKGPPKEAHGAAYGVAAAIHSALHANPHADEVEWFRVGPRGQELDHAETPI